MRDIATFFRIRALDAMLSIAELLGSDAAWADTGMTWKTRATPCALAGDIGEGIAC